MMVLMTSPMAQPYHPREDPNSWHSNRKKRNIPKHHHDQEECKRIVVEHFAAMHMMAMEKFFIPTEICMQEPVCGGSPTMPPKPTDGPDA